MVIDVHGKVIEHHVVALRGSGTLDAVGKERRNEINPTRTEFVPLVASKNHTMSLPYKHDAGKITTDVIELIVSFHA